MEQEGNIGSMKTVLYDMYGQKGKRYFILNGTLCLRQVIRKISQLEWKENVQVTFNHNDFFHIETEQLKGKVDKDLLNEMLPGIYLPYFNM